MLINRQNRNPREVFIPEAEKFANGLHDAKGAASRARWNRAFHSAMQMLVGGVKPTPESIDYSNLRWSEFD